MIRYLKRVESNLPLNSEGSSEDPGHPRLPEKSKEMIVQSDKNVRNFVFPIYVMLCLVGGKRWNRMGENKGEQWR